MSMSARALAWALVSALPWLLGCGGSPPPSDHPAQDDPAATPASQVVAPPRAQLAFLEVVEGPLPEEAARAALGPMRPRVQSCLAATSLRVEGHVVVRLEVAADGSIDRSGTDHVDGLDPELVFCVVRAIRGCRLPASDAPSQLRVGLDFVDPRRVEQRSAQPEVELADDPLPDLTEPAEPLEEADPAEPSDHEAAAPEPDS